MTTLANAHFQDIGAVRVSAAVADAQLHAQATAACSRQLCRATEARSYRTNGVPSDSGVMSEPHKPVSTLTCVPTDTHLHSA